jgi:hypothetical protein
VLGDFCAPFGSEGRPSDGVSVLTHDVEYKFSECVW